MVSAMLCGVLMAAHQFLGTCNHNVFFEWLLGSLLVKLKPGYTLVMDNARFHHSVAITKIVHEHGCRILYLPPYSPELNPIENAWWPLKNTVRKIFRDENLSLHDAVKKAISPFI